MINIKIKRWLLATLIACLISIVSVYVVGVFNSNKKALAVDTSTVELTNDVVLFDDEIGVGCGTYQDEYNIHHLFFNLKVDLSVYYLIDTMEFSLVNGEDKFDIETSTLSKLNGTVIGDYAYYRCNVYGTYDSEFTPVQLKAIVTYGDKTFTTLSKTTNLAKEWKPVVENDFVGSAFEYLDENLYKGYIKSVVKSQDDGFYNEVRLLKNSFDLYNKETHNLPLNATVFRASLTNDNLISFTYATLFVSGKPTYTIQIYFASYYSLYVSVFSQEQTESGQVQTNYPEIEETIKNALQYVIYDGYLYVRILDTSAIDAFLPDDMDIYCDICSFNDGVNAVEANTEIVVVNDKTDELQNEIDILNNQISDLEKELERVKEEYQAKIDELTEKDSNIGAIEEKTGLTAVQIAAIAAGIFIFIALVLLLMPIFRRKQK